MTYKDAIAILEKHGQSHLLAHYDELPGDARAALLAQIETLDFSVIERARQNGGAEVRGKITPIGAMQLGEIAARHDELYAAGLRELRAGRVGAVLLAGGMGTRLGSDAPKGMYNIGVTKDVFIFERVIGNLLDVVRAVGAWIHLYIMTSDKNNAATVSFLREYDFFGYNADYVDFFMQDMAPATDYDGKIYMEDYSHISMSPNGNGGWFSSMQRAGLADKARAEGVYWLNIFAVDNVLQRMADPLFVGAVAVSGKSSGAKVVKKCAPDEKVGVMCLEDGRPSIVEYYELTDELMNTKDANGDPAYNFGVILNYLFSIDELTKMAGMSMPLHIVEKKIAHVDENGNTVKPEAPNGYKYETLILDMVKLSESCLPFEVVREREFAPIKNKTGTDSVESARALLKKNGVEL